MIIAPTHLDSLFRAGFIAKGAVYLLIGGLTLATLLGFSAGSDGVQGPQGVLEWVEGQPLGNVLVALLGAGLLAYAAWRLYCGIADPHAEGHDPKSAGKRLGYMGSGLFNGALGVLALKLAFSSSGSGGNSQRSLLQQLLEKSWGEYFLIVAGVVMIGVGLYQAYKGYKADFVTDIHWRRISRQTIKRIGRYGHFSRAIVFAIIGYFIILTGTRSDADSFRGTEGALEWLSANPYGLWLLGITCAGLVMYGVFAVLKALTAASRIVARG